jgi:hypothetical protein
MFDGAGCIDERVERDFSRLLREAVSSGDYDEIARVAVLLYSMETTLYRDINWSIRMDRENGDDSVRELDVDVGLYAQDRCSFPRELQPLAFYVLLDLVVRNWDSKVGEVVVYRGVMLDEEAVDAYRTADIVKWNSFASASLSVRVARRFGNVLFRIHTHDCACIARAAALPREQEVLFPMGRRFRVMNIVTESGRIEIELCDLLIDPELCSPFTWETSQELAFYWWRRFFGLETALREMVDGPLVRPFIEKMMAPRFDPNPAVFARQLRYSSEAYRRDPEAVEAVVLICQREERDDPFVLFSAVRRRATEEVRRMIAAGAKLDCRDGLGDPILAAAVTGGSVGVVALLVDGGRTLTLWRVWWRIGIASSSAGGVRGHGADSIERRGERQCQDQAGFHPACNGRRLT